MPHMPRVGVLDQDRRNGQLSSMWKRWASFFGIASLIPLEPMPCCDDDRTDIRSNILVMLDYRSNYHMMTDIL